MQTQTIESITKKFVADLVAAIDETATERARAAVLGAIGQPGSARPERRGPGRPPGKARRKPPIQYCPVPGCKHRAAPVFGMLCAGHKDTPPKLVKKYREERRARKARGR